MGRNRSFDETEVLESAMHAFRRYGYAGISIKQLEEATGLSSGSLYNAYGDKDGLFRAAMAFYVDGYVAGRIAAHAGPVATLDDLEQLFLTLFREPMTDGSGCLVVNSTIEFGTRGSPVDEEMARSFDLVTSGIRAVLEREIEPEQVDAEASRLLLLYHGILVFSRAGRFDKNFQDAVRSQFDLLRQSRDRARARHQTTRERSET
jgi:TetR/AcrR family transcriptional repressor of nem operon